MKQPPTASHTHSGAKQGPRHLALLPSPLLIPAEWPEPGALCKAQQGPAYGVRKHGLPGTLTQGGKGPVMGATVLQ